MASVSILVGCEDQVSSAERVIMVGVIDVSNFGCDKGLLVFCTDLLGLVFVCGGVVPSAV